MNSAEIHLLIFSDDFLYNVTYLSQGIVRKRLLPIAVASNSSTGAIFNQKKLPFIPLEESIAAKQFHSGRDIRNNIEQARIESGHSVMVSPEAEASNKTVVAGEVISASPAGDIGVALVRLTDVLTKDETSPTGVSTVVRVQCVKSEGAGAGALDVVVTRPSWWVDIDPVTGKRVDTLDELQPSS
jgi:hypothetical protein